MYPFFRSLLFRIDPEKAHALSLGLMRLSWALPPVRALLRAFFKAPSQETEAFGLVFSNRVGIAAGYDKDGLGWRGLSLLGFGHIEVGTVTLRPQPGNPRPRLFRLPEEKALINRMGFPGRGAQFVADQLRVKHHRDVILGINIGKNKDTPLEAAAEEYAELFQIFAQLVDYIAINVSSPNTEGLRRLQGKQALDGILSVLAERRKNQESPRQRDLPILVKLAPDLSEAELDDALESIQANGMQGVIATNTTVFRHGVSARWKDEAGGLSGPPLLQRSLEVVRLISRKTEGRLPIIGVGGIMNSSDAQKMLEAGAKLIQVYTGLVYAGPGLVKQIRTDT
jgi:dihydroorotate dehydrogenase